MASAATVHINPSDHGAFSNEVRPDTASEASRLLQDNLENYHIYFNELGFHNHIVHHLLSSYALGADQAALQKHYAKDIRYQRPAFPVDEAVVNAMADRTIFKKYLGQEQQFANFLTYFQREIDSQGVDKVLNERVFAGDDHADNLLVRMFAGLLHPIIRLGFGLEFKQPAIVAEALAEAATHNDWIGQFLLPAEEAAGGVATSRSRKTIVQLVEECRNDPVLVKSVEYPDQHSLLRIQDGILAYALNEMIKYACQYTVTADDLEEQVAEMIDAIVYITAAAQRPDKEIKMDFFLMHGTNLSTFYPTFMKLPWLSDRNKARLLEWKVRLDLVIYVSQGSPTLLIEEITSYPIRRDWRALFNEGISNPRDDGHIVKMMRAVALGERFCQPYEGKGFEGGFPVHGDMWLRVGNMIADSTNGHTRHWVNPTGLDEGWKNFESRTQL